MIFVFDTYGENGYVPNLVTRTDIVPRSDEWWNLAITPPYSYEFRLLRYLYTEGIRYRVELVSTMTSTGETCVYPINLNYFDPAIDYLALMSEQARDLARKGQLTIVFYYSEGDDVDWHISPRLEHMCSVHHIPRTQIRFIIANRAAGQDYLYVADDELYYRYLNKDADFVREVNLAARSKKFTCLNRIDKPFRRLFAATLVSRNLHLDSYFSYTDKKYALEYPTATTNVEQWNTHWDHAVLNKFAPPYCCDELEDYQHNTHQLINKDFFNNAYWNVVVETHISEHTVFLTEKTFKPILNLQPFVVVGAPGSLALLHELGYQTFNRWVDESYDTVVNPELRLHKCLHIVEKLAKMSHLEHQEIMQEMQTILIHNQKLFLSNKRDKLLALLQQIEN
jgi:hypothetical protein